MSDKISYGVMKTNEYGNEIIYRVMCDCGEGEHDVSVSIEYDKDINMLQLAFYKRICWCSRFGVTKWYEKIWKKLSCSLKMLFTGYIELEEELLIRDKKHIDNFISALIDGKELLSKGEERFEIEQRKLN